MAKSQKGIAHLLAIISVAVVVLIGGIGYAVWHRAKTPVGNNITSSKKESTDVKLSTPKTETISPVGSVAATASPKTPSSTQVVSYDLTTPYGTLKHVEQLAKAGDYNQIAYFITPRVLFRASDTMGTPDDGDMAKINYACNNNVICKLAIFSTSFNTNFSTTSYDYGVSGTSGKIVNYNLGDINTAAAAIYGDLPVKIYMVGYDSKWVIDKVSVGSSVY